jgi:hemoglobin
MATHGTGIHEGALSDFQRVGGGPAVTAVVDRFYELLRDDARLAHYVDRRDLASLKQQQVDLLSEVLRGTADPEHPQLPLRDDGLEVSGEDLCAVVSYLVLALQESGVDPDVIARTGPTLAALESHLVARA